MVRVTYGDGSEVVAIVDGGCTHLFVVVRITYCKDSESDAIVDGGCTHFMLWLELRMVMIVRQLSVSLLTLMPINCSLL